MSKVDHRSDIFSFGIVLHEMLTGELPFRGPSAPETLSAIINSPTPKLELPANKEMAPELQRLMDKCLAKEPGERYQTVKDVVVDLRAVRRELESGATRSAEPAKRGWFIPAAIAALAMVAISAAIILWPRPSSLEDKALSATDSKPSIAVLFFDNMSQNQELDWLRIGLADMLITDLSQSPHLEVLTTDRLYQTLREIGRPRRSDHVPRRCRGRG